MIIVLLHNIPAIGNNFLHTCTSRDQLIMQPYQTAKSWRDTCARIVALQKPVASEHLLQKFWNSNIPTERWGTFYYFSWLWHVGSQKHVSVWPSLQEVRLQIWLKICSSRCFYSLFSVLLMDLLVELDHLPVPNWSTNSLQDLLRVFIMHRQQMQWRSHWDTILHNSILWKEVRNMGILYWKETEMIGLQINTRHFLVLQY